MRTGSIHLLFLSLALTGTWAYAQSIPTLMGSRSGGLGYATSCLSDEWALFNNPGGLAGIRTFSASFVHEAVPFLPAGNRTAAVVDIPLGIGTTGIGAFHTGDELFSQQILSAGYGNRFGLASLGAKVNYIQYRAEGFGNTSAISVSMGGIAHLTPHLMAGAYIQHINQPRLSSNTGERISMIMHAGIAFEPSKKIYVALEVEKEIGFMPSVKTGIEYRATNLFSVRTGFHTNPDTAFLGLGFNKSRYSIDYALRYHPVTGIAHQAGLGFKLKAP